MRCDYHCLPTMQQIVQNNLVPYSLANVSVNRRKWIIKQVYVCVLVQGSRQTNTSSLPTRKCDSSRTNDGIVVLCKLVKIWKKTANIHDTVVLLLIKFVEEQDILLHAHGKDWRCLGTIRYLPVQHYVRLLLRVHDKQFSQKALQQRRLSRANRALYPDQFSTLYVHLDVIQNHLLRFLISEVREAYWYVHFHRVI